MKHSLNGVAETLLITIRFRAMETERTHSLLKDPFAIEILKKIDFEESPKNTISEETQIGTIIYTLLLDDFTNKFIKNNPNCIIDNLDCGLDAGFMRLCPSSNISWHDIDIEESIELRKKFLEYKNNYTMIAKSMFDYSWMDHIPKDKPTLIVSERVFMYFKENNLRYFFSEIFKQFSNIKITFDV